MADQFSIGGESPIIDPTFKISALGTAITFAADNLLSSAVVWIPAILTAIYTLCRIIESRKSAELIKESTLKIELESEKLRLENEELRITIVNNRILQRNLDDRNKSVDFSCLSGGSIYDVDGMRIKEANNSAAPIRRNFTD